MPLASDLPGNDVVPVKDASGLVEAEVIGKHTRDILPPTLATVRLARYQQVTDSRQPLEFEDDRAGINFLHSFYPVLDAQRYVTAIDCFSRDITESKRAEDAMKLDAAAS